VHNPADHDASRLQQSAARSILTGCDGLFTHARFLESEVRRFAGRVPLASYPLPFTEIGPLPSRREARTACGLPPDRRLALFLGLIRPYKGVDLLLEAVAQLPEDSDWLVLVAGEPWGDFGRTLPERASAPDLSDRVRLRLGWVPQGQVPVLLAAADLVVLPYRSGSQSAVAPLALGAGVPVLSTAVGGLPELVRDGVDGRIVEAGSAEALRRALLELEPDRLAELAEGAAAGRGRLTWDGYAASLEALIEQVLAPIPDPQ
jgi:glycosyltransferase involved in cell wall biosynthesis